MSRGNRTELTYLGAEGQAKALRGSTGGSQLRSFFRLTRIHPPADGRSKPAPYGAVTPPRSCGCPDNVAAGRWLSNRCPIRQAPSGVPHLLGRAQTAGATARRSRTVFVNSSLKRRFNPATGDAGQAHWRRIGAQHAAPSTHRPAEFRLASEKEALGIASGYGPLVRRWENHHP
jgi:hypothetical protein